MRRDALLGDADAALERGDYPAAAEAISRSRRSVGRRNRRRAGDAGRVRQLPVPEAALAAERWLELNPTSEQARRYAGLAALKLHRLDEAEQHFAEPARTVYISPAARVSRAAARDRRRSCARRRAWNCSVAFRRATRQVAEGHYAFGSAALRADNFAARGTLRRRPRPNARRTGSPPRCCSRARASRMARKKTGSRSRATSSTEPESDLARTSSTR